uniref:T-cell receptor alpha/delta variable 14.0 n=1 Tax=Scleropages formosus TaxID=113540 RepID=A0A8C9W888_SCLFO
VKSLLLSRVSVNRKIRGNNVTLSCNYSGTLSSIQWYRQYSRSKPEYLLIIYSGEKEKKSTHPHLSVILDKGNNRVDLKFSSTALTDSAMYYCALSPTVTGNPFTRYKNLTVTEKHCILTITERSTVVYYIKWLIYHFLLIALVYLN